MEDPRLLPPSERRPARRPATAARRPAEGASLRACRVLVACSDAGLGLVVERLLRAHQEEIAPTGMRVRRVHDGLAALQLLELERPDLVVLHAGLEGLAPDALAASLAAAGGRAVPVLVLSALFGRDVPHGLDPVAVVCLPFFDRQLVDRAGAALAMA